MHLRPAFIPAWMFFCLLLVQNLTAQPIQEKEQMLSSLPSDTIRLSILLELGEHYCYADAIKALLFLQEALVLSTQLNNQRGIAASFLWQGRAYYYKDQYDVATQYLEKARTHYEELDHKQGLIYYHHFTSAINKIIGNHLNALRNLQAAADLCLKTGNNKDLLLAYCGMGNIHLDRSEPDLGMDYFKKALSLSNEVDDDILLSILFSNIGRAHEFLLAYDSALYYYEISLEKRQDAGGKRGVASSEYNIGSLLIKMNQYEKALRMLASSEEKYMQLKDETGICINKVEIAKALFYMGKEREANIMMDEVFRLAKKLNNPSLLSNVYLGFAPVMASAGRYDSAYHYLLINNRIQDSLAEINKEKIIRELEMQFQTQRREDEIRLLKSLNRVQSRNIILLYLSLSALVVVAALLFFLFRMKSAGLKRQRELYEREKTIRTQESQLREKEQLLMREQLEAKNRELASKALEMLRVNETLGDVIDKLGSLRGNLTGNEQISKTLNSIVCGLEAQLKNNSWSEFEKIFTHIHSDFFSKLLSLCPDLTSTEIKIAALLKLNLNTKEIAAITFKSEAGIKSTRYRLRKKLDLDNDESLIPFLMKLS
jgi:tetratricopeptide (TPR) repeat protein/DNA-binding CsgD family transcriptional regulator